MTKLVLIQPTSAFVSEALPLALGYIAAIAKNYGAEVKIIQPAYYALRRSNIYRDVQYS